MTRIALYARYSSDMQSASSIEDQFRICREQAAREKWKIVSSYVSIRPAPRRRPVKHSRSDQAVRLAAVERPQFQGSSSSSFDAGWSLIRRSTSASQASGSMSLSLAVAMRE